MYKKHSKLKGGSIVVFFLFILITFTLNPISVNADWTEDFSDNDLSEWELYATDWGREDEVIQIVEHAMYVEDGILKTDGRTYDSNVYQSACRDFDFVPKGWSGDVYNAPGWGWAFNIGRDIDLSQNTTLGEGTPKPYYYLIFWNTNMNWYYGADPNVASDLNETSEDVPYVTSVNTAGWHSYIFEFGDEKIDLYMDGDLIFSRVPSHVDKTATFDTFDDMCLVSNDDSPNMFDNVTLSEAVIDPTNGTSLPDSNSDDGDASFTLFVFGSGSIMAITSVYTLNRYFKKKE